MAAEKEKGLRVEQHNSRSNKNRAYSAHHNDRTFDVTHADHIDASRTAQNTTWHYYQSKHPEWTFAEAEDEFYFQHFLAHLEQQNERHIANHHPERCKTLEDYQTAHRTCPEEQIIQVGKKNDHIDPNLLWRIVGEQLLWERKTFPNVFILDAALHVDEATPHVHIRKVWTTTDRGCYEVSQKKALAEMGIERPHPEKEEGRHNNAKMTYTAMCREHLEELCRKYGIELAEGRLKASQTGLEHLEYKRQQIEQELQTLQEQQQEAEGRLQAVQEQATEATAQLREVQDKTKQAKARLASYSDDSPPGLRGWLRALKKAWRGMGLGEKEFKIFWWNAEGYRATDAVNETPAEEQEEQEQKTTESKRSATLHHRM